MQIYRQQLHDGVAETASANGALVLVIPRNVVFVLDVTAITAGSLDVDIEAQDPVSGKWFVIDSFTQAVGVTNERRVFSNLYEANLRVAYTIVTGPVTFTVSVQGKEGDEA